MPISGGEFCCGVRFAQWYSIIGIPNMGIDFDVRISTLMHNGKTKRQKPNVEMDKLGCFVSEETFTILN